MVKMLSNVFCLLISLSIFYIRVIDTTQSDQNPKERTLEVNSIHMDETESVPPSFDVDYKLLECKQSEQVKFECEPHSNSMVNISVFEDEKLVDEESDPFINVIRFPDDSSRVSIVTECFKPKPYDQISISCVATNQFGKVEKSHVFTVIIAPNSPPTPTLVAFAVNSTSVELFRWLHTIEVNNSGQLVIRYRETKNKTMWLEKKLDYPTERVLNGLKCGTKYVMYGFMQSVNGVGDRGNVIHTSTSGSAPIPPKNSNKFLVINTTNAIMHLNQWQSNICKITHFTLRLALKGEDFWRTKRLDGMTESFTYESLEGNHSYILELVAFSEAGVTKEVYVFKTINEHLNQTQISNVSHNYEESQSEQTEKLSLSWQSIIICSINIILIIIILYKTYIYHCRDKCSQNETEPGDNGREALRTEPKSLWISEPEPLDSSINPVELVINVPPSRILGYPYQELPALSEYLSSVTADVKNTIPELFHREM